MTNEQIIEQANWDRQCVFNRVCDPRDWKRPIDSMCSSAEIVEVAEAIEFFTATTPTFDYLGKCKEQSGRFRPGDYLFKVRADGYRKGPAGDH